MRIDLHLSGPERHFFKVSFYVDTVALEQNCLQCERNINISLKMLRPRWKLFCAPTQKGLLDDRKRETCVYNYRNYDMIITVP